jgi:hypothetical protein
MVLLFFLFPAELRFSDCGSGRGEEPSGGKCAPPDSDPFNGVEFGKNLARLSRLIRRKPNRRFEVVNWPSEDRA